MVGLSAVRGVVGVPEDTVKLVTLVDVVPVVFVENVTAAANESGDLQLRRRFLPIISLSRCIACDFDSGWFGYGRHSCAALRSQRTAIFTS